MLTFLRSSTPVLVMMSSMSVLICNHFHVRRAYSGKKSLFKEVPLFRTFVRRDPFTQRDEILTRNTKPKIFILPGLGLVPGRDGQTDRQNYRS